MTRRALQIATALLAPIPIVTGAIGMTGLDDPLYVRFGVVANDVLDSNLRFFSGVWLGAGIAIAWLVPRIERETTLFRALWAMIFLGGVGRLVGLAAHRSMPLLFAPVLVLELLGAPLFVAWQRRVAAAHAARASSD
jgi:hypothetical protein